MKKMLIGFLAGVLLIPAVPVFAVSDAFLGESYPNVCVGDPIQREGIGGTRFPIAPKYKHLDWLGQLFTADDCGSSRLNQFYGSEDSDYTFGSTITLKRRPTTYLRRLLQTLGYVSFPDKLRWSTDSDGDDVYGPMLPVRNFLLLKTYYKQIKSDDCTDCG